MKYRIIKKAEKNSEKMKVEYYYQIQKEWIKTIESSTTKKVGWFKKEIIKTIKEEVSWISYYGGFCGNYPYPKFKTLKEAQDWIKFEELKLPEDEVIN